MKEKLREKLTVMILPVGTTCNLNCTYCYHSPDQCKVKVMSDKILELAIKNCRGIADKIDFLWHGGEPLLAGKNHFCKAVELEKLYLKDIQVRNIIQTNLTVLKNDTAKVLSELDFLIGTSIDGPKKIHNAMRVNKKGNGTFDAVAKGIRTLKINGKGVGAIALITTANVNSSKQVFAYMKKSNISNWAFHITAPNKNGNASFIPKEEKIISFLKQVFDLWFEEDDPNFRIRNFVNVIRVACGGKTIDCAHRHDSCKTFVAIDNSGNVFPCHRFANNQQFVIGCLKEKTLRQILVEKKGFYDDMAKIPKKCFSCARFNVCGGGCAYERLICNSNFASLNPHCRVNKEIFKYIQKRIK